MTLIVGEESVACCVRLSDVTISNDSCATNSSSLVSTVFKAFPKTRKGLINYDT